MRSTAWQFRQFFCFASSGLACAAALGLLAAVLAWRRWSEAASPQASAAAVQLLKDNGARNIRFLCLLAAPEGIARMKEAHPDVPIVTAAVDRHLNDHGYIVPGLGDAGDRMFGTK